MSTLHPDVEKILLPEEELKTRVAQLGEEISRDYAGREPVLLCESRNDSLMDTGL